METTRLLCEPLYQATNAAISAASGAYVFVGQIQNPSQLVLVQNLTNAIITFSFDGQTDNFELPASGYLVLDIGTNKAINKSLSFAEGTSLYCKGTPSSGNVNLTSWYMG